jgi:hypothetical protein
MNGDKIESEVDLGVLGNIPGLVPAQATKVDRSLIVHVPNWKTGDCYWGMSDYHDLTSIFYALNNRLTKTDNILDKHSDPILMVPPGVLDEKGQVRKKSLGVIEVGEGDTGKPEYIVWDASLENAFKEIEKLTEYMYMIGEISPDILGMGQGMSDSGRALKFKLMRTIAKAARKKLYYNIAIKELVYVAQLLAKAHSIQVDGVTLKGDAVVPELEWADGLPMDNLEQVDLEIKKVDAGLRSKRDAIMAIDGVDEKNADKTLKEINDETKIEMKSMDVTGSLNGDKKTFGKTNDQSK